MGLVLKYEDKETKWNLPRRSNTSNTLVLNIPFAPPYTTFQEKCSFSYIPISTINSGRIYKKTDNKKREFHLQSQIHAPVITKKKYKRQLMLLMRMNRVSLTRSCYFNSIAMKLLGFILLTVFQCFFRRIFATTLKHSDLRAVTTWLKEDNSAKSWPLSIATSV